MNRRNIYGGLVLLVAAVIGFYMLHPGEKSQAQNAQNTVQPVVSGDEDFKFYTVNDALQEHEKTGKKLFIDVYATWCGPCKMLEKNTFSNPVIQKLLSEYFIPARFNAECDDTITFQGKQYINPHPNAGPHAAIHDFTIFIAQTSQGVVYPTMVFLDENLNMIQPVSGYLTPEQLEPILDYFGTDAYKTTKWADYTKSFHSEITQ